MKDRNSREPVLGADPDDPTGTEAHIVGNLAGVVEWANEAFERLSGIALSQTLGKPVARFLERAGIELDVVDLIAQSFFEGRLCRVAFPYKRPDGRRVDVLLEVEALRDEGGEIDRFRATAREQSAGEASSSGRPASRPDPDGRADLPTPAGRVDLNSAIRRAVESAGGGGAPELNRSISPGAPLIDLDLSPALGPITGARESVEAIVADLFEAARLAVEASGNAGNVITLSTATAEANRRFISKVHPIAAYSSELADSSRIVLEVHDTGPPLSRTVIESLDPDAHRGGCALGANSRDESRGECPHEPRNDLERSARGDARREAQGDGGDRRAAMLFRACEVARRLGARVLVDSTPGCGNQVLVLLSPAPETPASQRLPH
jgi:PAS domain S-box-containing protein